MRLQSDERLVALVRRGNQAAFEALVQRYQPRLLSFCRHMLSSQEDAEDVLQEVFAAAYNALLADERKINARPWLYRIARNRSLNHLRKPRPAGQDSMDIFERDHGVSTADTVHSREEFRNIIADVGILPESQRTALLLREIDALSYDQIAEAMDTTVPSVKSLLVRARVTLAEASEARLLTCGEVRLELGQVAEGLTKTSAPVRRHLKGCDRCRIFRGELRSTSKALAAIYPIGPLVILKKLGLAHLGFGGGAAAGSAAAGGSTIAGGAGIAGGAATVASGGAAAAGGAISAGVGTLASKAAAGMAAAAIVTAGAVEVRHVTSPKPVSQPQTAALVAPPAPSVSHAPVVRERKARTVRKAAVRPAARKPAPTPPPAPAVPVEEPITVAAAPPEPAPTEIQEEVGTVKLPPRSEPVVTAPPADPAPITPSEPPPATPITPTDPPPAPPATAPSAPLPAPPAGEPAPTQPPPPPPPPPAAAAAEVQPANGGATVRADVTTPAAD